MNTLMAIPLVCLASIVGQQSSPAGNPLAVDSVLVTLIDEVEVPAQAEGALISLTVREGDSVAAGEELGRVDDLDARSAARQLELEADVARREAENDLKVRFAHKNAEVAKAELRRAEESVKQFSRAVSGSEIDRLRLTAERTELEILQADHEFAVAKLNLGVKENAHAFALETLSRRAIAAPIDGVVVQVNRQQGEWVKPGDSVLRVVRIDRLRTEGFLLHNDFPEDPTGRRVMLTVDLPGRKQAKYPGKVTFVSPEVNPVSGQVRFWAEIENQDGKLRPGIKGRLAIE
ncbi:MAG: HlyD family efflux transporter periplasmic adaptor subunit [Planctomycetia bacterium]|nr:HlyD family efflux transporter periplasmic adaptor subunit [Planctomycetia bacterium]